MRKDTGILIAEDDDGHYSLIERNLYRSGIHNEKTRFRDGQEILDFLMRLKNPSSYEATQPWLLILDIRMPKIDGIEILGHMKQDPVLKLIPVIVMTTADNEKVIEQCHELGCNVFIVKPVDYEQFIESMSYIGHFLSIIEIPVLHAE